MLFDEPYPHEGGGAQGEPHFQPVGFVMQRLPHIEL